MSRHVHLLPVDRLETQCVAHVLAAAGIDAHVSLPSSECRGAVVMLKLEGAEQVPPPGSSERVHVMSVAGSTTSLVTAVTALMERMQAQPDLETSEGAAIQVDNLTPRELEIASMLAGGWRNEEIAKELGISAHTVRTHVQRVLGKLQVHHRLALAAQMPHHVVIPRPLRPGLVRAETAMQPR